LSLDFAEVSGHSPGLYGDSPAGQQSLERTQQNRSPHGLSGLPLLSPKVTPVNLRNVGYTPIGSALVAAIAPEPLRGVYLSVNSMCWAVGYLIGPPLGGWALDQGDSAAHGFWLGLMATVVPALAVLMWLDRRLCRLARS
ncbi:MAG: hypothetical protein DCF32_21575, partial [Leptolyngbya sp.]